MIKIKGEKYANIKEYADYKNVTIQTVYNWIKKESVKTKKIMDIYFIKM